ncbi:hypothetical protein SAMN04515692_12077 [Leifsonia sp. CL147]|nr:hypothetical protein SAMN04515694_11977 [Leifsonia sp. CL154]SFL99786.1 hypothetical protein SAMN04515692_12077 [Leifsonia sp. CL147]
MVIRRLKAENKRPREDMVQERNPGAVTGLSCWIACPSPRPVSKLSADSFSYSMARSIGTQALSN